METPGFRPIRWSNEEPEPMPTLLTTSTMGTFCFPKGGQQSAKIRLHKVQDGNNLFWFGVAEFSPALRDFPGSANPVGGSVTFADGLSGGVSFMSGKLSSTGLETGFIGLSALSASPQRKGMSTLEFTIDVGKNAEEMEIIPVGEDGKCDIPGAAMPADPSKTLLDIVAGDYLLSGGIKKRVVKVRKLE